MRITAVERDGDLYLARGEDGLAWSVVLPLDLAGSPFRAEVVWPAAAVVAVGGGGTVCFLALETGALRASLSLDDDLFGSFGPTTGDVLHVLGWRHVVAIDASLAVRWRRRDVAVDGILWRDLVGDRLLLSAELDPPGGWVDVELDAATGRGGFP